MFVNNGKKIVMCESYDGVTMIFFLEDGCVFTKKYQTCIYDMQYFKIMHKGKEIHCISLELECI